MLGFTGMLHPKGYLFEARGIRKGSYFGIRKSRKFSTKKGTEKGLEYEVTYPKELVRLSSACIYVLCKLCVCLIFQ